ncbi:hypothetical protein JCM19538_2086 [Jejuia pallidilutea]|uniref:Uncharacterized protein n=1 Tax=Jejuia pallidilutea TaxID=504487 RepID=A0A098LRU1_9FLAO|nr:hypothetical protein JCM19538_2086 [Jejuia pallidilutea]
MGSLYLIPKTTAIKRIKFSNYLKKYDFSHNIVHYAIE